MWLDVDLDGCDGWQQDNIIWGTEKDLRIEINYSSAIRGVSVQDGDIGSCWTDLLLQTHHIYSSIGSKFFWKSKPPQLKIGGVTPSHWANKGKTTSGQEGQAETQSCHEPHPGEVTHNHERTHTQKLTQNWLKACNHRTPRIKYRH